MFGADHRESEGVPADLDPRRRGSRDRDSAASGGLGETDWQLYWEPPGPPRPRQTRYREVDRSRSGSRPRRGMTVTMTERSGGLGPSATKTRYRTSVGFCGGDSGSG